MFMYVEQPKPTHPVVLQAGADVVDHGDDGEAGEGGELQTEQVEGCRGNVGSN